MQSRRRQGTVSTSNRKLNITARSSLVRKSLAAKNKISFREKSANNVRAQLRTTRKMFDENQIRAWKRTYWLDTFRLLTPRVPCGRPVVSAKTCDEQTLSARRKRSNKSSAHFPKDHNNHRGRDFKNSLFQFPITNNKLPVRATGKTKSLDLFQRKHDKQAIQRLKRVRKGTKKLSSPFTAPGWNTHNGKPVFNLSHTCTGNLHVRAVLIRVFISTLVHLKGFKWSVNTRYACVQVENSWAVECDP